jgi:putative polyhydroxyalkanoate system protein
MSTIHVVQTHSLPFAEVKQRLARFEENLAKVGARLEWNGQRAVIKAMGVSGEVVYSPSDVRVNIKLGLMAKAAGVDPARLEGTIQRRLAEALSPTGTQ